jgi:hypothetical protein
MDMGRRSARRAPIVSPTAFRATSDLPGVAAIDSSAAIVENARVS